MKSRFIFIQLCLSLSLVVCQTGFARTPMENVHPGYNLYTIRPDDFEPPTTGLAFNSKGELLITTYHIGDGHNYQMPGEVYLLRGTEGTDRSNIQVIEFANGFQDPMGLFISNDSVYVVSRGAVTVLFDDDGDGEAEYRKVVYEIETYDERMWSFGPVIYGNKIYVLNSCEMTTDRDTRGKSKNPMRGVAYTIDGEGKAEVLAGGFRQPDGLMVSPKGEIFATVTTRGLISWAKKARLFGIKIAAETAILRKMDSFSRLKALDLFEAYFGDVW